MLVQIAASSLISGVAVDKPRPLFEPHFPLSTMGMTLAPYSMGTLEECGAFSTGTYLINFKGGHLFHGDGVG